MTDQVFETVRHFTYFHPLTTLGILCAILVAEISVIVIRWNRKFPGVR